MLIQPHVTRIDLIYSNCTVFLFRCSHSLSLSFCLHLFPISISFAFNFTRKRNIASFSALLIRNNTINWYRSLALSTRTRRGWRTSRKLMAFALFHEEKKEKSIQIIWWHQFAWLRCKTKTFIRFFAPFTFIGRNILKRKIHDTIHISQWRWHRTECIYIISHMCYDGSECINFVAYLLKHIEIFNISLFLFLLHSPAHWSVFIFDVSMNMKIMEWDGDMHACGKSLQFHAPNRQSAHIHTHTRTKRNNATRKNIIILFIIQFNIHKVPWDWKHLFSLSSLSFFFVNAMAVNTPPFTQSHSHAKRAPF